jgi:GTP-binding protein
MEVRNIAIIAHVDHGKTTLTDALLKAGEVIDAHKGLEERAMDTDDQEKERGITIYAKNASIFYKGTKINLVDTPGHADFGSEVERILRMIDAAVLLVDAFEGPMPQTKFVLSKSLALGLPVLVVLNKIDKPMARPEEVLNMVFDLFANLGASDEQLDFPYVYTIAKQGIAIQNLSDPKKDITPLLDAIIKHVPLAKGDALAPCVLQPATLQYDSFLGRIGVGRVYEGTISQNQTVYITGLDKKERTGRITKLFSFFGMEKREIQTAYAGDIVAFAGIENIFVGETVSSVSGALPLKAISVDPPALAMNFMVNDSPFAGQEGKFVTSRNIRERLIKELETNVGLKIDMDQSSDSFTVYGRGEMHLAVLIEKMRREGFELQVSQPRVVTKEENGVLLEPFESVVVTVPDEFSGKVIEALSSRKAEMKNMKSERGNTFLEFEMPTRGILGFRSEFILMTKGEGIFYSSFLQFAPFAGKIEKRNFGSMISGNQGEAVAFSLWNLQERGNLFM